MKTFTQKEFSHNREADEKLFIKILQEELKTYIINPVDINKLISNIKDELKGNDFTCSHKTSTGTTVIF
jgi:hypothetical protein